MVCRARSTSDTEYTAAVKPTIAVTHTSIAPNRSATRVIPNGAGQFPT